MPFIAFGKAKWAQYFGDVGVEPSLPPDIHEMLNAPCPFWPNKKVHETHLLTLVPSMVNGQRLTLNRLGELIQQPLGEGKAVKYRHYWEEIQKEYGNTASLTSQWILITKDVIPMSREKTSKAQKNLLNLYNNKYRVSYQVPFLIEAAISILMEYVQNGNRLYSNNDIFTENVQNNLPPDEGNPYTFTLCQERISSQLNYPLVVGGFQPEGLDVNYYPVEIRKVIGVAGCLRL